MSDNVSIDSISDVFSDDSSDSSSDDDDFITAIAIAQILMIFDQEKGQRIFKYHRRRLNWQEEVAHKLHTQEFDKTYRMSHGTFVELVNILREDITVDEVKARASGAEPIYPELVVAVGLRWLAGGRYSDLRDWCGISTSSFYRIRDVFLTAVMRSDNRDLAIQWPENEAQIRALAQGFQARSSNNVFTKCIGAIDGMLVRITQPRNVDNPRCYFSGHYECFGINIQAVCDAELRFYYVATGGPGCTPDITAYSNLSIHQLVKDLPDGFHLNGDAAYVLTNHLLTPFTGRSRAEELNDIYNYYLSQLRIRIEMAFGRLTTKFRIFRSPMEVDVEKVGEIVTVAAKLHNFIINRQMDVSASETGNTFQVDTMPHANSRSNLGYIESGEPDEDEERVSGIMQNQGQGEEDMITLVEETSHSLRDSVLQYIADNGLERPAHNVARNQ